MYKWKPEELKLQLGKIFQLYRLRKGISQLQLGNEVNLSGNHIGRIERGETNPTIEIIIDLCSFLQIDILELFTKLKQENLIKIDNEIEKLKLEFKNQNKRKS